MSDFFKGLQTSGTYPLVMRISKEVSDEYGKRYAECVDENKDKWLVYSDRYLTTAEAYFFHSKTQGIAISPYLGEKIF